MGVAGYLRVFSDCGCWLQLKNYFTATLRVVPSAVRFT